MRILNLQSREATTVTEHTVVALGFFDGVHLGHRELLSLAVSEAKSRGLSSAVLTFSESGGTGLKNGAMRLSSEREKLELFRELGIDYAVILDFQSVKNMSPEEFVRHIVVGVCNARLSVCGYNFRFGRGAAGDADTLVSLMNKENAECIVYPAFNINGSPVSSTAIRRCVEIGDVKKARELLGRPFSVTGEVYHGKGLGHTLGSPTANQYIDDNIVKIKNGVYVTRAYIDGEHYYSVTNVGVRPTVDSDGRVNCETHIMGYNGDLYGREVTVEFLDFIREEMRFSSVDELKKQIYKDMKEAEKWQNSGRN